MTTVTSPLAGRVIGLAAVPDPVFSGAMVGPGTAIDPLREPGEAVSPLDGVIVSMHPHAFVVVDDEGHGVLTHLGNCWPRRATPWLAGRRSSAGTPRPWRPPGSRPSARSWRWRPRRAS
jgi:hypothetical protein